MTSATSSTPVTGRPVRLPRSARRKQLLAAAQQVAQGVSGLVLPHDVVVDVAVIEGHVLLLQVDAVRDEGLEDVALRAEKPAQLRDRVLQMVDALERILGGLLGDLVLQDIDLVIELFEHRKRRVDERVDGEVGEERGLAVSEVRALVNSFL